MILGGVGDSIGVRRVRCDLAAAQGYTIPNVPRGFPSDGLWVILVVFFGFFFLVAPVQVSVQSRIYTHALSVACLPALLSVLSGCL